MPLRWEYHRVVASWDLATRTWAVEFPQAEDSNLDRYLESLGERGWEMVAFSREPRDRMLFMFKRPKP